MDCSPSGSSVHGILEWVAIPFSMGSSWHRNWTWVSCIAGRFFTIWTTREAFLRWLQFTASTDFSEKLTWKNFHLLRPCHGFPLHYKLKLKSLQRSTGPLSHRQFQTEKWYFPEALGSRAVLPSRRRSTCQNHHASDSKEGGDPHPPWGVLLWLSLKCLQCVWGWTKHWESLFNESLLRSSLSSSKLVKETGRNMIFPVVRNIIMGAQVGIQIEISFKKLLGGEGNGTPLPYSCWRIPWMEEPGGL